jgi:uncharacterized protein
MVHAPKALWHPVLVIVDEAHTYAPEKGYGESVALQSMIDIANLGRKRGFALVPATQRLSKLSKNVTEPMQNLLVGRTMFDDQERAGKIFKVRPGAEMRTFSLELERLKDGQFIARGRAFNGDMLKVQVIRGETRPPATGTAMAGLVTPTPAAVKALLPKLADLPKEAEQKQHTEDDLRKEIADLKRQLGAKPAVDTEEVDRLRSNLLHLENSYRGLASSYDARAGALTTAAAKLEEIALDLRMHVNGEKAVDNLPPERSMAAPFPKPAPMVIKPRPESEWPKPFQPKSAPSKSGTSMPKACRAVLTALAQHGQCSKSRIAALTGYAVNGGGFNNSLSECRTKGWITGSDPVEATHEGLTALGPIDPLPSGDELLRMWEAKLGKAEREILGALVYARDGLDKEKLASLTGYAASGGGFNNAISRLRTLELVEGKGSLRLTPDFAQAVRG